MSHHDTTQVGRRAFLKQGTLLLAACVAYWVAPFELLSEVDKEEPVLRAGLITDLHYADKPPAGSRHYRETLDKLAEAKDRFDRDKLKFIVELGDLIDAADSVDVEKAYLSRIDKVFSGISKDRHYVLGNHCVDTLTKAEFLEGVGQKESHYSFDREGFHFVVLDACFNSEGQPYGRKNFKWNDANIPDEQVEWLAADLKKAKGKAVVFIHQRLDVSNHYGVKNAPAVRQVLEESSKVLAVFQGHSHNNDLNDIGGIHYCTLAAMVEGSGAENNSYTTMDIHASGAIKLAGYRRQKSYDWRR